MTPQLFSLQFSSNYNKAGPLTFYSIEKYGNNYIKKKNLILFLRGLLSCCLQHGCCEELLISKHAIFLIPDWFNSHSLSKENLKTEMALRPRG